MLNYDLAQIIDNENPYLEYKGIHAISFVNCMDQLKFQNINQIDQFIHLRPQIFLDEKYYMGEHDSAKIIVNKAKSKFGINIESLVTNKNYNFYSNDKTKIKTPFANKKIFSAGQLINRKFKQGISFVPKNNEGISFGSKEYKKLLENRKYNSHSQFEIFNILDLTFEKLEYSQKYNKDYADDLCAFEKFEVSPTPVSEFTKYLNEKYVVYPYKVTESWQLAFDVDVNEIDIEKTTSLGSTINISYYVFVLGYSEKYLDNNIQKDKILFSHANFDEDLMFSRYDLTQLGKVYKDDLMTNFNVYTETVQLDDFTIEQYSKISPIVYESPNDYELEIEDEDNLLFYKPKVISMLPMLDK